MAAVATSVVDTNTSGAAADVERRRTRSCASEDNETSASSAGRSLCRIGMGMARVCNGMAMLSKLTGGKNMVLFTEVATQSTSSQACTCAAYRQGTSQSFVKSHRFMA